MENEATMNEVNEINETPAAPVGDVEQVTAPDDQDKANTEHNAIPAVDLSALTDEERDLYNEIKDYPDAAIATMPPAIRKEIADLKAKLAGNTAPAETAPSDTANGDVEKADVTPAADTPAPAAEEGKSADNAALAVDRTDEIIRRLTEENRRLNARYDTLQGKYNAEIKAVRKSQQSKAEDTAATEAPAPTGKSNAEYAEELGLDEDVVSAIRKIAGDINPAQVSGQSDADLKAQVAELYANRQNSLFDAAIRAKCGNDIGLHEVGTDPLFPSYAQEMYDKDGKSAWDAIADAKANGDHAAAANIISQVVDVMKENQMWNVDRHPAKANAEPVNNPAQSFNAATATVTETPSPAKVSQVAPHSTSGVRSNPLHTARTLQDVMNEYDALEKRFRRGDTSVVTKITQLSRELSKLAANQPSTT